MKKLETLKVAVIGLGYVGLPLSVEFGKVRPTIGFDLNKRRIEELYSGKDNTLEISEEELSEASLLKLSSDESDLEGCNCFIITVPTPIDKNLQPDLSHIESATRLAGRYLTDSAIVIYESTVYPGCTEEICVPILEEVSGMKFIDSDEKRSGFYCGYSPERINPGDKEHSLTSIVKVTSGSTPKIANLIDKLYGEIISAGTFKASSIKVAESAKVIENSQRDLNIAFMNELSKILNLLEVDTQEVLEAASTKWNFLKFSPGLVGGHCIGVDPYYLTHKAKSVGYTPDVILSGRALNDSMGKYVSDRVKMAIERNAMNLPDVKVLICGLTFKENCPDIRNTKVIDIYNELKKHKINATMYDPWVNENDFEKIYNAKCSTSLEATKKYDVLILATPHDNFISNWEEIKKLLNKNSLIFDLKGCLPKEESNFRL